MRAGAIILVKADATNFQGRRVRDQDQPSNLSRPKLLLSTYKQIQRAWFHIQNKVEKEGQYNIHNYIVRTYSSHG